MNLIRDNFFENKKRLYWLLAVVPFLLYLKSFFYELSPFDESWLILRDQHFLSQWSAFGEAFVHDIQKIYYRPILTLSFVIDVHLGGINPFIFHFSNVIYHLLACLVLFRFLLLFCEIPIAFILSLFFAVHPMALNAVAWVPGRNDSLLFIFTLLALYSLLRLIETGNKKYLLHNVIFFLLALFTKESGVILPLAFCWVWFMQKGLEKKLFLMIGLWATCITAWFFIRNSLVTYVPGDHYTLMELSRRISASLLIFIGKFLLPIHQSIAPTPENSLLWPGIAVILFIVWLFVKNKILNRKLALTGLGLALILLAMPIWYGCMLPLCMQDEHRSYTALAGILLFLSQINFLRSINKMLKIGLVIISLFSVKTFIRMDVYKTVASYLAEGLIDCPQNFNFPFHQAELFYNQGNFKNAISYYTKAINLRPDQAPLYNNRANSFAKTGQKDSAIADYTKALSLTDRMAEVWLARCLAYRQFGDMENCMKDLYAIEQAYPGFIKPEMKSDLDNEYKKYNFDLLTKTIRENPTRAELYVQRAKVFMDYRMGKEALYDLKKACELEPNNEEYRGYYNELNNSYHPKNP